MVSAHRSWSTLLAEPDFENIMWIIFLTLFALTSADDLPKGAVVTNGPACAKIGVSVLEKGGTAVDAAIAALFCEGVSVPNCMGLGGGFLMNIYIKENKTHDFLNSREVAPMNATEDMYGGNESFALKGGLAVGVPGELKGYWEAYNKYGGGVPWKDLVVPTIDLCNDGIVVTKYLEKVLASQEELIMGDEYLRETFINPETNKTYVVDEIMKRPRLAKTLELVADIGPDVLYDGNLTTNFVDDLTQNGGIITAEDLKAYQPQWKKPIEVGLPSEQILYAPPLPGSGVILGLIMEILSDNLDYSDINSATNWQRIIESFKFGYARRTELGDLNSTETQNLLEELISDNFVQTIRDKIYDNQTFNDASYYGANVTQAPDHGTANLCVLAPNGDAVVVTSTINTDFGAGFMSGSTGIILNNQMDDFSSPGFDNTYGVPPSPNNYIAPGKRPMSSMSPSIIVGGDGTVRLLVGGSGGTKIITSVALTIIKNLWFNYTIKDAVADKRLHHQLFPMEVQFEDGYESTIELFVALKTFGHEFKLLESSEGFNTITSISLENGTISAAFDPRRGGGEEYVYTGRGSRITATFTLVSIIYIFIF